MPEVPTGQPPHTLPSVSKGYQLRDSGIVDYQLWQAGPGGEWLRGPAPPSLRAGSYFACVGAAQTFGCFVARPWPALLAEHIGLPALNLGIAGAGPARFREAQFRPLLANARFVVFQVLSGRSADCSRFQSGGHERLRVREDGRVLGADAAWSEVLHGDLEGLRNPVWRGLVNRWRAHFGRPLVRRLVDETRADWLKQFTALLAETAPPKLLLWFSRRPARYRARFHSLAAMFANYPQLVDERLLAALAARADGCVECITARGSPQLLRAAVTGEPTTVRPADAGTGEDPSLVWTHNAYYPSPEMHEDAAAALLGPARLLARAGSAGTPH
jgi:hypothetical protein